MQFFSKTAELSGIIGKIGCSIIGLIACIFFMSLISSTGAIVTAIFFGVLIIGLFIEAIINRRKDTDEYEFAYRYKLKDENKGEDENEE